jgi:prolipoprotein diacylglyceryl transferase
VVPRPPAGARLRIAVIAGIVLAIWIGERRWRARGGEPGAVGDVAMWAVPFGLVGARLYHVLTSPQAYFGPGGDPVAVLRVWQGGLGIWGGIAAGALGAWIACRRRGLPVAMLADAVAPGIAVGQAVGRLGNWVNQELYGRPSDLPWALQIDPAHRLPGFEAASTYHPAFLYEALWNLGVAALVVWADRRFRLDGGRVFALYIAAYTAGRFWIEGLRIDPAFLVGGPRLNQWMSVAVFAGAVLYLVRRSPHCAGAQQQPRYTPGDSGYRTG